MILDDLVNERRDRTTRGEYRDGDARMKRCRRDTSVDAAMAVTYSISRRRQTVLMHSADSSSKSHEEQHLDSPNFVNKIISF